MSHAQDPGPLCFWAGREFASYFSCVPRDFLESIGTLGITPGEAMLVIVVLSHQHSAGSLAFPGHKRLANCLGLSRDAVKRTARNLREKGLLETRARIHENGGFSTNVWDFSPLLDKLEKHIEAKKAAKAASKKRAASKKGKGGSKAPQGANPHQGTGSNCTPPGGESSPGEGAGSPPLEGKSGEGNPDEGNVTLNARIGLRFAQPSTEEGIAKNSEEPPNKDQIFDDPTACSVSSASAPQTAENEEESETAPQGSIIAQVSSESRQSSLTAQESGGDFAEGVEDFAEHGVIAEVLGSNEEVTLDLSDQGEDEMRKTPEERRAIAQRAALQATERASEASERQRHKRRQKEQGEANLASLGPTGIRAFANRMRSEVWGPGMARLYPDTQIGKWGAKEYGQLKTLVDRHGHDIVELSLRYLLDNWESIHSNFFPRAKEAGVPTIGFLLKFDQQLVIKAQKAVREAKKNGNVRSDQGVKSPEQVFREVEAEWNAWWDANPKADRPPKDLSRRLHEAKRAAGKR